MGKFFLKVSMQTFRNQFIESLDFTLVYNVAFLQLDSI